MMPNLKLFKFRFNSIPSQQHFGSNKKPLEGRQSAPYLSLHSLLLIIDINENNCRKMLFQLKKHFHLMQ